MDPCWRPINCHVVLIGPFSRGGCPNIYLFGSLRYANFSLSLCCFYETSIPLPEKMSKGPGLFSDIGKKARGNFPIQLLSSPSFHFQFQFCC